MKLIQVHQIEMTGRTFFAMLFFASIIAIVMWLFILPALTTYRPTLP